MTGIFRYFSAEPARTVLSAIEGVNFIERLPPQVTTGVGFGTVCIVGEFEDGPYNTPTEVFTTTDFGLTFGGLGHVHDGKPYSNPVAQRSGGDEHWNGNGFLYLYGVRFTRTIVVRAKVSSGVVSFRRRACLEATLKGPFDLEPADDAAFETDGAPTGPAVVNATAGVIDAVGGSYPTNFIGGEKLRFLDERGVIRTVTFKATDQAIADVVAAINAQLGYDAASDNGGQLQIVSRIRGRTGYIKLVDASAAGVLTQLGLTTTDTAEVDRVTVNVAANGVYTFTVQVWYQGVITTYTGTFTRAAAETITQIRDGLISNFNTTNPNAPVTLTANGVDKIDIASDVAGVPITTTVTSTPNPGDFTASNVTANSTSYGLGTGNVDNIDLVTAAELAVIFAAISGVSATVLSTGYLRICNTATPETGTIEATSGAIWTALGITTGELVNADDSEITKIPAGTRIRDTNGTVWVTLQTYETDAEGGPFDLDVRPAQDDDTAPTALAGTATTLVDELEYSFAVTNDDPLIRPSANQIDSAYSAAIRSTIDSSGVSRDIDIIFSARTSAAIMEYIKSNVAEANVEEHNIRAGIVSPPLGTSKTAMITGGLGTVGVVGQRVQEICYVGVGFVMRIPEIAQVGSAGGIAYTDDGIIEIRGEHFYASVRSILPPEQNAGQELPRTVYGRQLPVLGLEKAYNKDYGGTPLQSADYIAFKAAGIIAPKIERSAGATFQSDVTSVDPATDPVKADAARMFFLHFLANSLRVLLSPYVKALLTPQLRRGLIAAISSFLDTLKSEDNPSLQRILNFDVRDETSPALASIGQFDLGVEVQMIPAALNINIRAAVGTTVKIAEAA